MWNTLENKRPNSSYEASAAAERATTREEHQRAMAAAQQKLSARRQFNLGAPRLLKAVALVLFLLFVRLATTPTQGGKRGAAFRPSTRIRRTPSHGPLAEEESAREPPRPEAGPMHPLPSESREPLCSHVRVP
jgi:hypothetical protein